MTSADRTHDRGASEAPAATRSATPGSNGRSRRPRVPAEEAQRRLIDATIEIIREHPFQEATVRAVADAAGVQRTTIERNFGSMTGLYKAVAYELSDRYADYLRTIPIDNADIGLIVHPDAVLRIRLISWLVSQGVDAKEVAVDPEREVNSLITQRNIRDGVEPNSAWVFSQMIIYMIEGLVIMSGTHERRDNDILHGIELIQKIRDELPRLTKELWPDGLTF